MKNPFSIRSQMGIRKRVFLLLLVIFVPLLLLQAFTFYRWYRESKEAEMQANLELARTVSKTFAAFINDVLHTQHAIGLAATSSPPPSNEALRRILRGAEEMNPMLRSFAWISPEGVNLVNTNPSQENRQITARNLFLFQRFVAGEECIVSDLYDSPYTGEKIFTIGKGVRDSKGNLLGVINCACVADKLDSLLAVPRSKNAGISLIDSKGIHVYRYPTTKYTPEQMNWLKLYPVIGEALKGKEVVSAFESRLTGMQRLVAFVPIPSIGWVASCSRAEEETIAGIFETLLPQALLILLVTLAAFGAAVTLSRPISMSIRRLQGHAAALGRGEMERLEAPLGPREIKNLAETFNDMAEKVRSRESALQESEQFLRAIFKATENAIIVFDEEQRCIETNAATGIITGVLHEDLAGRSLSDFVDPGFDLTAAWSAFVRTGRFKGEIRIRHSDGTWRTVEAIGVANILPGRHLFVAHDITERNQAEAALRAAHAKTNAILEKMSDGFVTFDRNWRYTHVNPAAARMFHITPEQLLGKTLWELWPTTYDHPVGVHFRRSLQENIPLQFESFYPEPLDRWFECRCHPISEGLATFFSDITERKRAEEGLRKAHLELELRVQARTAELERKNMELQEFAFVASHDLSEPLRKIQTFGDLLEAKNANRLDEQSRDYISRMAGAAKRMQELLDALLRYSRVDTKGQEFRPSKLDDVVRDAVKDLEVPIRKIEARLEISHLPIINCDPYQWRQLFQNLIANSLKYYRSEVKPLVRVYGEEKNGHCRILVKDNGIGFDEKYVDKIFQPFQRLHGKNEYPGTGIGLAICRKIVERHGGTITAKSTPGKGSTFIVTLPVNRSKETN